MVLYGDYLSKRNTRLQMQLSICDVSEDAFCNPDSAGFIRNSSSLGVTIGSFTPSVDNSNKFEPLVYGIDITNRVPIEGTVRATTTVGIHKIEAQTNVGRIIDIVEEEVAAAVEYV